MSYADHESAAIPRSEPAHMENIVSLSEEQRRLVFLIVERFRRAVDAWKIFDEADYGTITLQQFHQGLSIILGRDFVDETISLGVWRSMEANTSEDITFDTFKRSFLIWTKYYERQMFSQEDEVKPSTEETSFTTRRNPSSSNSKRRLSTITKKAPKSFMLGQAKLVARARLMQDELDETKRSLKEHKEKLQKLEEEQIEAELTVKGHLQKRRNHEVALSREYEISKELKESFRALQEEMKQKSDELLVARSLQEKAEKSLEETRKRSLELKAQVVDLTCGAEASRSNEHDVTHDYQRAQEKIQKKRQQVADLRKRLREASESEGKLKTELLQTQDDLVVMRASNDGLREEVNRVSKEVESARSSVSETLGNMRAEMSALQSSNAKLNEEIKELGEAKAAAEERQQEMEQKLAEAKEATAKLQKQVAAQQQEEGALRLQLQTSDEQRQTMAADCLERQTMFAQLATEKERLEKSLSNKEKDAIARSSEIESLKTLLSQTREKVLQSAENVRKSSARSSGNDSVNDGKSSSFDQRHYKKSYELIHEQFEVITKERDDALSQKAEAERNLATAQEASTRLYQETVLLEKKLNCAIDDRKEIEQTCEETEEEVEKLQGRLTHMGEEFRQAKKRLSLARKKLESTQKELSAEKQRTTPMMDLTERNMHLQHRLDLTICERDRMKKRIERLLPRETSTENAEEKRENDLQTGITNAVLKTSPRLLAQRVRDGEAIIKSLQEEIRVEKKRHERTQRNLKHMETYCHSLEKRVQSSPNCQVELPPRKKEAVEEEEENKETSTPLIPIAAASFDYTIEKDDSLRKPCSYGTCTTQ